MMASHHQHHQLLDNSLSWEQQQSVHQQQQSLEESAEQVSQLFATTVKHLAADVHALKQLTTWKEILEESNEEENDEDRKEDFLESLCDLEDVVTAVERKVGVLRQIVSEEQRALENLNLLQKESLGQNENLQFLVERCRNMKVVDDEDENHNIITMAVIENENSQPNQRCTTKSVTTNHKVAHAQPQIAPAPSNHTKTPSRAPLGTSTASTLNHSASHQTHVEVEGLSCHFDPVTAQELETVPRTTRGRVQVVVINEALENIGKCFHKKAIKIRRQQQRLEESRQIVLAPHRHDSFENEMDDEEFLENLAVTEQELRKSCAFFLAGEGTARTVLAVLKALRRIKQVPQKKKGLFAYRLCLD